MRWQLSADILSIAFSLVDVKIPSSSLVHFPMPASHWSLARRSDRQIVMDSESPAEGSAWEVGLLAPRCP